MIYAINTATQDLSINENLVFTSAPVSTSCNCNTTLANGGVQLRNPGIYLVEVNADASISGATAGDITIQLQNNGVNITGAEATANSTATTDIVNLKFTALVRVLSNCCAMQSNVPTTLTVVNTGVASTITNSAITVTKVS